MGSLSCAAHQALEVNKLKEIKNGRLAMIAFTGFVAQHAATGKVPARCLPALSMVMSKLRH